MKQGEEKIYFEKEWAAMERALDSFLKTQSEDDLHDFRVQVKKIFALLLMLGSNHPHLKLLKHFKPVRQVFKAAGVIRNAHINLQLSQKYNIQNEGFINSQLLVIENAGFDFILSGKHYHNIMQKAYKKLSSELPALTDAHFNLFFEARLNDLVTLLTPLRFNKRLHEARTIMKQLMYNYKLAQPAIGFNKDYVSDMQALIGDWHDNDIALQLLTGLDMKSEPAFKALKKANAVLKKQIREALVNFYNNITILVDVPVQAS